MEPITNATVYIVDDAASVSEALAWLLRSRRVLSESFASAEAYTSDMKIISTAQGQPHTSTIKGSARWLSTDCGAVKPFAPPKK